MKLLHIDSSILGDQSVSRQLTASIVAHLKQTTPGLEITYRDLAVAPVPQQSPTIQFAKMKALYEAGALPGHIVEMVAAAVQGGAKVDASTQAEFAETNVVLDEFLAADIVVLGAPMYNFGIPSQLKAWIDCLAAPGKTFKYSAAGVEGLAGGKKLIIASSRGGILHRLVSDGLYGSSGNIPDELLRVIGIRDATFVRAEGLSSGPEQRKLALETALAHISALKAA